jgi:nitrogen fixation protein FixH
MSVPARSPRQITGPKVLVAFVAFFAIVTGVNAVLLRAATSTFGGVEVASAYRAGLSFNKELAAAARQDELNWKVEAELARQSNNRARLVIKLHEADDTPARGIDVAARLIHPADGRRDHGVALHETSQGEFEGTTDAAPGRWDLLIEATRADEILFRSRSRVTLK